MDEQAEGNYPLAYLITIRSYGTWLHGDEKGSVGRQEFNIYGTPRMFHSEKLKDLMKKQMKQKPTILDKKKEFMCLKQLKKSVIFVVMNC